MVSFDCSIDRAADVTYVAIRVENPDADRARRVRVENRLDGPVWPPRRQGRPVAGWDRTGFEGVVDAAATLPLGYATPGEPLEGAPPAELVSVEPTDGTSGGTDRPSGAGAPLERSVAGEYRIAESTPAGVVRSLGAPVVPREAVPVPVPVPAADPAATSDPSQLDRPASAGRASSRPDQTDPGPADGSDGGRETDGDRDVDGDAALAARLFALERRLAALEAT